MMTNGHGISHNVYCALRCTACACVYYMCISSRTFLNSRPSYCSFTSATLNAAINHCLPFRWVMFTEKFNGELEPVTVIYAMRALRYKFWHLLWDIFFLCPVYAKNIIRISISSVTFDDHNNDIGKTNILQITMKSIWNSVKYTELMFLFLMKLSVVCMVKCEC